MNLIIPKEIIIEIKYPKDQVDVADILYDWKIKFQYTDTYNLIIEEQNASHLSYARTEDFLDVLGQCGVVYRLKRIGYRIYELEVV